MVQIIIKKHKENTKKHKKKRGENVPFSVLRHPLGPNEHVARTYVTNSA